MSLDGVLAIGLKRAASFEDVHSAKRLRQSTLSGHFTRAPRPDRNAAEVRRERLPGAPLPLDQTSFGRNFPGGAGLLPHPPSMTNLAPDVLRTITAVLPVRSLALLESTCNTLKKIVRENEQRERSLRAGRLLQYLVTGQIVTPGFIAGLGANARHLSGTHIEHCIRYIRSLRNQVDIARCLEGITPIIAELTDRQKNDLLKVSVVSGGLRSPKLRRDAFKLFARWVPHLNAEQRDVLVSELKNVGDIDHKTDILMAFARQHSHFTLAQRNELRTMGARLTDPTFRARVRAALMLHAQPTTTKEHAERQKLLDAARKSSRTTAGLEKLLTLSKLLPFTVSAEERAPILEMIGEMKPSLALANILTSATAAFPLLGEAEIRPMIEQAARLPDGSEKLTAQKAFITSIAQLKNHPDLQDFMVREFLDTDNRAHAANIVVHIAPLLHQLPKTLPTALADSDPRLVLPQMLVDTACTEEEPTYRAKMVAALLGAAQTLAYTQHRELFAAIPTLSDMKHRAFIFQRTRAGFAHLLGTPGPHGFIEKDEILKDIEGFTPALQVTTLAHIAPHLEHFTAAERTKFMDLLRPHNGTPTGEKIRAQLALSYHIFSPDEQDALYDGIWEAKILANKTTGLIHLAAVLPKLKASHRDCLAYAPGLVLGSSQYEYGKFVGAMLEQIEGLDAAQWSALFQQYSRHAYHGGGR